MMKDGAWTDEEFPPTADSICIASEADERMEDLRERVVWKRATEIFEDPVIFSSDINPDDINQTNIGSCYFLAALSAMTEFPELIKNLFGADSQVVNDKGVYTIFLYIGG